jgi:hypothetical protein
LGVAEVQQKGVRGSIPAPDTRSLRQLPCQCKDPIRIWCLVSPLLLRPSLMQMMGLTSALVRRSTRPLKSPQETTHGELIRLLSHEGVKDSVSKLTGANSSFLEDKFSEIRNIRNLIAHNRALSSRTSVILLGLIASLEESIDCFKQKALYAAGEILSDDEGPFGDRLAGHLVRNDWSKFQAFVSIDGPFIKYVSLPVDRAGNSWPDARLLLKRFKEHLDGVVAFCRNKQGDEFCVMTPLQLEEDLQLAILDAFVQNPYVWTDVPFAEQSPRHVCSPKIWFYENRSPLSDI